MNATGYQNMEENKPANRTYQSASLKAAYVLLRFPCLTETFVAEEIQKMQAAGIEVCIYSLLASRDNLIQPVSVSLLPFARTAPNLLHPALWAAQLQYLFHSPRTYFNLAAILLKQPSPRRSVFFKRLAIFWKSVWIARDLEKRRIDLIHTHFAWLAAAAGWIAGSLLEVPYTITAHAYDIYSEKNDLLPLTARNAARVITISQKNRQAIKEFVPGLPEEKIQVIHCGVDLDYFTWQPAGFPFPPSPLQITSVGSLIEKKGHEYLIRACDILKREGFPFRCNIIGAGELEQELTALVRQLGLDGMVTLTGKRSQDQVKTRLSVSNVFILACVRTSSSDQDGIPVAMMEAMAMGVPVISTPVSGIPELITHGVTGLLVNERDPEGIARSVTSLVQDTALRTTLQVEGRKLVEKEYNIITNVDNLKQIFFKAVAQRGSQGEGRI